MEYRALGQSGLRVSVLTSGTETCRSGGLPEEILRGRQDRMPVATRVRTPRGHRPNDTGLSCEQIISGCEASPLRHQAKTAPDRLFPAVLTLLGPYPG